MIRAAFDRRALIAGLLACGLARVPAAAQSAPPLDEWESEQPDIEGAKRDGFEIVEMSERQSDPKTATLREKFIVPIEQAVGQDGTHDFEWSLEDLNGDGYSDVVLAPRAPGLGLGDRYEGIRMLVFTFDGKEWRKSLDAGGQAVGRRTRVEDGVSIHEIAMIQPRGYFLFRWNGTRFVEIPR